MLETKDDVLELSLDLLLGELALPQAGEGLKGLIVALLDGEPARRLRDEPDGDGDEEGDDVVQAEGDEEGRVGCVVLCAVANSVDKETSNLDIF